MTSGLKDVENTDNIQIGNQGRGKNDLFQITRIFEFRFVRSESGRRKNSNTILRT